MMYDFMHLVLTEFIFKRRKQMTPLSSASNLCW